MHSPLKLTLAAALFIGCAAHAEPPKPKAQSQAQKPRQVEAVVMPEFVDGADAVAALQALSDLRVAELKWQTIKVALRAKYGIDPDKGDGWDPEPDGRLRARRIPDAAPAKEKK